MKAGFARLDITPPLGTTLRGYFHVRPSDGIITPLYVNTVVFDDGEKKAALITLDLCGYARVNCDYVRNMIQEATEIDFDSIMICCTHTHLGPNTSDLTKDTASAYDRMLATRIRDSVTLAIKDLEKCEAFTAKGRAEGISFVRIYRMKDGSIKTNPGKNPDVVGSVGTPDEDVQLLRLKRHNAPDIAIVNFQTHPDVIGSVKECACKICYDWPGFVRDILEETLSEEADGKGVHAICLNGAEGDVNHVERLNRRNGITHSKHMARVIAGEVLGLYTYAEKRDCTKLVCRKSTFDAKVAKGTPEQVEIAREVKRVYDAGGATAVKEAGLPFPVSVASKFITLANAPDTKELFVNGFSIGDVAFVGFPGEVFTEVGRQTKKSSPFAMTLVGCLTNGTEGYFPTNAIFEGGGYEAGSSRYAPGTAEKFIDVATELTKDMFEENRK